MAHALRALLFPVLVASALVAQESLIQREALIQDTRYLGRILEEAHPDPFTAFGGRIAFHRELQNLILALPPEGLTIRGFHGHLAPFVARLRDSHTSIRLPKALDTLQGPGLPLTFRAVGDDLVVAQSEDPSLLGGRLLAVHNQDMAALRARINLLQGIENPSGELLFLMEGLAKGPSLRNLLPAWPGGKDLQVRLQLTDGQTRQVLLPLGPVPVQAAKLATRVTNLPETSHRSLAWSFLDPKGQTACLTLADSVGYRENVEVYLSYGTAGARTLVEDLFRKQQGRPPKDDVDLVNGFPSALETFKALALAMKARGTQNLLVDVRENSGGNSLIAKLLVYVLEGQPGLRRARGGYSITRTSQLLLDNRSASFLETFNAGVELPLELQEYSFAAERRHGRPDQDEAAPHANWREFPSLAKELDHPQAEAVYKPARVYALTTPRTFSAGFDVILALHRTGARVVGVPSGQAGNCFIDLLRYQLPKSRLVGGISYKAVYGFPDDPVKGRMLPCDLLLTRERFRDHGFDANSEVLMALDDANRNRSRP